MENGWKRGARENKYQFCHVLQFCTKLALGLQESSLPLTRRRADLGWQVTMLNPAWVTNKGSHSGYPINETCKTLREKATASCGY